MKLNSKTNFHFRFILSLSYLIFIWYPTNIYLFMFPIALTLLDEKNKPKKFKSLALLVASGVIVYFYLKNLDIQQQIALSFIIFILDFSDVLKKAFRKNTI
ncbi:hypothetical protein ACTHOQ_17110 [Solibacillus silvestris]|uniref:hypothetical protein n=1 Tax=Solibacillus silvestris TaxID=76853 RepID=UPI003F7EE27B